MNRKLLTVFIGLLACLVLTSTASAIGVIFARPVWGSDMYNKMWIKTVDVDVDIQGQIASTLVKQEFLNEMSTTVEAVWIFPLPEGAVVTELYYWFNGVGRAGSEPG